MADKKITQLTNITGANLVDADEFVVVDISADETKAITLGELKEAFDSGSGFVRITGDTMTGDLALSGADVTFGDNDKAIFGAGSDLQIYHNGSNSYIDDAGTGSLWVRGNDVILGKYTGEYYLYANADGALNLYYDGTKKLNTTSTGVDITGTLSSDGLTVDGSGVEVISVNSTQNGAQINFDSASTSVDWSIGVSNSADGDFLIYQSGSGSGDINLYTGGLKRQEINRNGDISFYEDTGTTAKFFWDASAEGLNIGAASVPFGKLDISDIGGSGSATIFDAGANGDNYFTAGTSGIQVFRNGSTEAMRITSSGRVGIGTSSPDKPLHILSTTPDQIVLEANSTTIGPNIIFKNTDGNLARIASAETNTLRFEVGPSNTEAMRIDSSGNVGIGTDSPSSLVHANNTSGDATVRITSSDTGYAQIFLGDQTSGSQGRLEYYNNNNSMGFYTSASEAMRITSSGLVGIGTSSPTDRLNISSGTNQIGLDTGDQATYGTLDLGHFTNGAFIGTQAGSNAASNLLRFGTSGTERMRIDSSGNVGIGGTPDSNSKLHVFDSTASVDDYTIHIESYTPALIFQDISGGPAIDFGIQVDGSAMMFRYGDASTGTQLASEAMRIDSSGNVGIATTDPIENLTVGATTTTAGFSLGFAETQVFLRYNNYFSGTSQVSDATKGSASISLGRSSDGVITFNTAAAGAGTPAEAMRITNNGSVGIGTDSPSTSLDVSTSSSTVATFRVPSGGGANNKRLEVATGGDRVVFKAYTDSDSSAAAIAFNNGASSEAMRITSSGNLLIKTASHTPTDTELVVSSEYNASGTTDAGITLSARQSGNWRNSGIFANGDALTFTTGDTGLNGAVSTSEKMRLDSSGNLLVGTTDSTPYNNSGTGNGGSAMHADGLFSAARDGNAVGIFNRLASDGDIVEFRKDGLTKVGSIGVEGSAAYFAGVTYGIKPYSAGVAASNNSGVFADGTADLGKDNIRWKDLYLSGGVYLGGTGAANKLDDYEEGTWTPTAIGTSGEATLSEASGSYTKVGRMVTVNAEIDVSSVNTASGIVRFGGLPFTVANIISPTSIEASGSVSYWAGFTSAVNSLTVYADDSSTILDLTGNTSATATAVTSIGWTNMGTGEVRFSLTYFTT